MNDQEIQTFVGGQIKVHALTCDGLAMAKSMKGLVRWTKTLAALILADLFISQVWPWLVRVHG